VIGDHNHLPQIPRPLLLLAGWLLLRITKKKKMEWRLAVMIHKIHEVNDMMLIRQHANSASYII
jgi:hypothetical protein